MDETPLFRGRAYLFMLGTKTVIGTITDITVRLDIETLEKSASRELGLNEIGRVAIRCPIRWYASHTRNSRELGGFILIDRLTTGTVGAGMVTTIRVRSSDMSLAPDGCRQDRRGPRLNGQKPAVLWFTGLSGAGKSTIANMVEKRLLALGHHTMTWTATTSARVEP